MANTSTAFPPSGKSDADISPSVATGMSANAGADASLYSPPVPLFALVMGTAMTDIPAAHHADARTDTDANEGAPADIASAATSPESSLPAMAVPLMMPPANILPQADAAAIDARNEAAQVQTQVTVHGTQAYPALNISPHPATFSRHTQAALPTKGGAREPLAAANPLPVGAGSTPAAPAEAPLARNAPVASAVTVLDGERTAKGSVHGTPATPAAPPLIQDAPMASATSAPATPVEPLLAQNTPVAIAATVRDGERTAKGSVRSTPATPVGAQWVQNASMASAATIQDSGRTANPAPSIAVEPLKVQSAFAPSAATVRDGERAAAPFTPPTPNLGLSATLANGAPALPGSETIKLNGPAQQWQEPLREALGERLQTQIGRNSEHAMIRLEPPMLGRIEISIRHTAGALQVNVTASNPEVLRQLQSIGENMRSDLAQRQYTEVAVNISATPRSPAAQAFAEGDARGQRQPGRQNDDAEPGRALSDGNTAAATYALHERETT
ncbi:flagellar hook-length control protein FliK [Janthinobacterium sp. HLX7-2]|uniref:flagellar hook-length control protein FliK n=1 Tax=Janthinobacterium sp. HLX7-2 TaxID=1259331 RepID=UPI003F219618